MFFEMLATGILISFFMFRPSFFGGKGDLGNLGKAVIAKCPCEFDTTRTVSQDVVP